MRATLRAVGVGGASLGAHAIVFAFVTRAVASSHEAPRPTLEEIALELPTVTTGSTSEHEPAPEGVAPVRLGGATVARVDDGHVGAGGERTGARATNLAAVDDEARLDPDPLSRLDRDQIQRLATARRRATRDDRRATTRPMELTLLATGPGQLFERRPLAATDPSRGALVAAPAAAMGGTLGASEPAPGRAGIDMTGGATESPGVGVRARRAGAVHRRASAIAFARPDVAEAAPTIPAETRGRANDTTDSEQEVAAAVQSLVHASFAGGLAGAGRGGTSGEGEPGAGAAVGRGSFARAMGDGDDLVDWSTNDPALMPYFRKIHAKVDPLWRDAFPREALLELKQGTVILEVVVDRSGRATVSWPPLRPSGVDAFDRNCADAVRRASPFDPIPPALGRSTLRIRAPFVAKNPIVK